MTKIVKKTTWCQQCLVDKQPLKPCINIRIKDQVNWVCDECFDAWHKNVKKALDHPQKTKFRKMTKKEMEKEARATQRQLKRQKSKSLRVRKLEPGERLPEARSDFTYGSTTVPIHRQHGSVGDSGDLRQKEKG